MVLVHDEIAEGWHRVSLSYGATSGGSTVDPSLWYLTRSNPHHPARFRLEPSRRGQSARVIYFPADLSTCGIEFPSASGLIEVDRLSLRPLSRGGAVARMTASAAQAGIRDPKAGVLSVRRGINHLRAGGIEGFRKRLVNRYNDTRHAAGTIDYDQWLQTHGDPDEDEPARIAEALATLVDPPLFSILLPVYNTPERWLSRAIDSVRAQLYTNWELIVVDDASTDPAVRTVLNGYRSDPRIKVTYRPTNGHIAAASNTALQSASGEWVGLLDHDDELDRRALAAMALFAEDHADAELVYSDEDKIDERQKRSDPFFKPNWNLDLFLSQNYLGHFVVAKRALIEKVGGFNETRTGSQDYDLWLRCVQVLESRSSIGHVPLVLYHWRSIPGSTALDSSEKTYAETAALEALTEHLALTEPEASIEIGEAPTTYRVHYPVPSQPPLVSIVIPTRNGDETLAECIDSIRTRTSYENYELVIVDNQSDQDPTLEFLESCSAAGDTVLRYDKPFNYAAINNYAVEHSNGEIIVLLNDDVEVITPNWLTEMASHALRPTVGVVGAKLLYPDGTLQHGGVITGIGGVAGHSHKNEDRYSYGYFSRLVCTHQIGAVTAACLATRRTVWEELGALDDNHLAVSFNDIDYCLKARGAGYDVIWTPWATLFHHESKSRGPEDTPLKQARFVYEAAVMADRWGDKLRGDPSYNPNLTLDHENFGIAERSRVIAPWTARLSS